MCSPARPRDSAGGWPRERLVCLVLLEHVVGTDLWKLKGGAYNTRAALGRISEEYRLYVWARLLKAENWLEHIGVHHGDLVNRNIMLDPPPAFDDDSVSVSRLKSRLIIIDFDRADITRGTLHEGLPPSPILKWWHHLARGLVKGWVPFW